MIMMMMMIIVMMTVMMIVMMVTYPASIVTGLPPFGVTVTLPDINMIIYGISNINNYDDYP